MSQEVGVAYVSLLPSGRGFGKAVEKEIDQGYSAAEKKGGGLFTRLGKLAKGFGLVVAGAVGTVGALAAGGGISRALNIEDAQAKLKGLGHDTRTVEAIMKDALNAVRGTAFGLDSAATVAASAVASGIEPGKELERYLRLTADAATIAGTSLDEMGSILNKVTAKGVAQMDDLNRLTERGIPILQWLADEYGVTADELSEMVSRGEVDAETFRRAIENNISGAALASGETTRGAFANMMSALSRLGAQFAGPFMTAAKGFMGEMIVVLDGIGERLKPATDALTEWANNINFDGLGERILDTIGPFVDKVAELIEAVSTGTLQDFLAEVSQSSGPMGFVGAVFAALQPILPVVRDLFEEIGSALEDAAPKFGDLLTELEPLLPVLGELLVEALEVLIEIAPSLVPLLVAILEAVVDMMSAPEFQGFLDWLAGVIDFLGTDTADVLHGFADGLRDIGMAGPILADFIDWFAEIFEGESLVDIIENAKQKFAEIGAAIAAPFAWAWGEVSRIWGIITTFLSETWGTISKLVTDAWNGIGETIGGVLKIIVGLVTGDTNLVKQQISGFLSTVSRWWSDTWNGIKSFLSDTWTNIKNGVRDGINGAVDFVRDFPGKIQGAVTGAATWLLEVGKDIVRGMITGITSMIGSAVETVKNLAGDMLEAAKDWLGIHSPSRVFRDQVGVMVGRGLVEGLDQMIPKVEMKMTELVQVPDVGVAGGGDNITLQLLAGQGESPSDQLFRVANELRIRRGKGL